MLSQQQILEKIKLHHEIIVKENLIRPDNWAMNFVELIGRFIIQQNCIQEKKIQNEWLLVSEFAQKYNLGSHSFFYEIFKYYPDENLVKKEGKLLFSHEHNLMEFIKKNKKKHPRIYNKIFKEGV